MCAVNSGRFWMMDEIDHAGGDTVDFHGLGMRWAGDMTGAEMVAQFQNAYAPNLIQRNTIWTWHAGKRVHLLREPGGTVWVLQEYTKAVDPSLTPDNLDSLGKKFKDLPKGWKFEIKVLDKELGSTPVTPAAGRRSSATSSTAPTRAAATAPTRAPTTSREALGLDSGGPRLRPGPPVGPRSSRSHGRIDLALRRRSANGRTEENLERTLQDCTAVALAAGARRAARFGPRRSTRASPSSARSSRSAAMLHVGDRSSLEVDLSAEDVIDKLEIGGVLGYRAESAKWSFMAEGAFVGSRPDEPRPHDGPRHDRDRGRRRLPARRAQPSLRGRPLHRARRRRSPARVRSPGRRSS